MESKGAIKMKKGIKYGLIAFVILIILAIIGNMSGNDSATDEKAVERVEASEEKVNVVKWDAKLNELANNSDTAADKFYELEKYMMDYKAADDEIETFKKEILNIYQDGTYLANPTNHETMLNLIFKSYMVEQSEESAWKDFAFDFHQNVKYVYRGADTADSQAVKSNEEQMNKVINDLN